MGTLVPSGFKLISFAPLRSHPAFVTARRLFVCGKIALISGWCSAKTTGFMLGRIFFLDTKSYLQRQTPSPLALLSTVPSRSDATSAGRSNVYKPSEVLRVEHEPPESFTPHPLFRDEDTDPRPGVNG